MRDYPAVPAWHERLLGSAPTCVASDTGVVWEPAEHRSPAVTPGRPRAASAALSQKNCPV
ncbi:hypothetical protein [Saccharothrix lopnurensis]|uniref:Glutathione S-transferase-like protein n=1 Tax=Saccharothrix lopnurensis TaxID=1670621 RepID=A0ABW1P6Q2_9PSEU